MATRVNRIQVPVAVPTRPIATIDELMVKCDWSQSPLGAPEDWSPSLKTTVSIMLAAQAQIVLFWGPHFVALYNDAYAPSIGDKHPRALGRPAIEHWTELWDDLQPLLQSVRNTCKTVSAKDRPFYIERHGYGETAYFDISYSPVHEADGSVGGVLCIVAETTQRVISTRRQAALLDLEDQLAQARTPDEARRAAAELLRNELAASAVRHESLDHDSASQPRAVGAPEYVAAKTDSPDVTCTLDVPVMRDGKVAGRFTVEIPLRHLTEGEIHFARSAVERAWGAAERIRAEHLLRRSDTKYRTLFERIDEGFCVIELLDHEAGTASDCELMEANPAFSTHTGLTDVLGKRMQELLPQEAAQCMDTVRRVLETNASVRVEWELPSTGRHLEVAAFPVPPAGCHRVAMLLRDVTARKRDEAELQHLNRDLEQRVAQALTQREEAFARVHEMQKLETIGQLTGGVAHDFNNLLTPIVSALEMVALLQADDERIAMLTNAGLQAAERARTLVQRLLAFARRQHLEARATDVRALVRGMADLLSRSLGPRILLSIECDPQASMATVDPNQLELALLNLAVNSRDAMPDGGSLTIGVAEEDVHGQSKLADGRYIRITVSDNGSGMDEQTMKRAVEPFFTTKTKGHGTGLGLSMVHGLAAQSGGHFALSSRPGNGTTAALWLPASAEQPHREPERSACAHEVRPVASVPVLLVDDEELVRLGTAEMLAEAGYIVRQASSGWEALSILAKDDAIGMLITDYAMPGMTGVELARQIALLRPGLPVLMITGFASMNDTSAEGVPRLSKPFRQRELIDAVSTLLDTA